MNKDKTQKKEISSNGSLYSISLLLIWILFISFPGCASTPKQDIQQLKSDEFSKSTSKEAFDRVESKLLLLKPGDYLKSSGLVWNVKEIRVGQRVVGLNVVSDGWIRPLSGGVLGGISKFGALSGRSENKVFGVHLFGYVFGDINVVPRYAVITQADIIASEEFNKLKNEKVDDIGWIPTDGESKIYIKNIMVKELQKLNFREPTLSEPHVVKRIIEIDYNHEYLDS